MNRLTRRTEAGKVLLNKSMFPEYAEETLQREMAAFPPFSTIVERLCEYEEVIAEMNEVQKIY
ncbi:MAG: hypothetical protein J1G06_03890 [Oscillospiraceae bacterium]|nr:hypothetical protein [Oscillospiraceae bacterium]